MKTLTPTDYKPNFKDPRTQRKVKAVLKWCDDLRLSKVARTIHHDELRTVIGNTNQRGLAQWLFANLLSRSGQYEPGRKSFSYRLQQSGYEKVYRLLNETPPTALDIVLRKYGRLIDGVEHIEYVDKSNRRFHPIQNIRREVRRQAFSGWWDYDIEACAATLVYQYAVQHYCNVQGEANDDPFPTVTKSIHAKEEVRAHVAALTGLDRQNAKELIQALFFRAQCAPHHKSGVFKRLHGDMGTYIRFVSDPFVAAYKQEVEYMWRWARLHELRDRSYAFLPRGTPSRKPRKSSKIRMAIFLSLERRVMDSILDRLGASGRGTILMHDGFMSKQQVSASDLEEWVKSKTGFAIKLKECRFGASTAMDDEGLDPDPVETVSDEAGEEDVFDGQIEGEECHL